MQSVPHRSVSTVVRSRWRFFVKKKNRFKTAQYSLSRLSVTHTHTHTYKDQVQYSAVRRSLADLAGSRTAVAQSMRLDGPSCAAWRATADRWSDYVPVWPKTNPKRSPTASDRIACRRGQRNDCGQPTDAHHAAVAV